jgi:two-component system alkaline phosphatase synthesis response regulator PhoP
MYEKILIVEDEVDLVKGLKINLADEGYEVIWALNGEEGLRKSLEEKPDLIILDIMLPKMDGLEICRELRKKNIATPIIMLSAKGEEIDKVVGLEIGADDYLTKPFSIRELLARIKAQFRREQRSRNSITGVYQLEDIEIDLDRFVIRKNGNETDLTSLEVEILKYLIDHKGEVVKRDDLLDNVWGYESYPSTRTIDNHILKLRKKIEKDQARPRHILSVYGEGYRFME